MAVVRSDSNDSDINYLIAENQNIYLGPGVVKSNLTGLRGQNYSTVLYELNGGGLPVEQAASFPKNVSLSQNGKFIVYIYSSYYKYYDICNGPGL